MSSDWHGAMAADENLLRCSMTCQRFYGVCEMVGKEHAHLISKGKAERRQSLGWIERGAERPIGIQGLCGQDLEFFHMDQNNVERLIPDGADKEKILDMQEVFHAHLDQAREVEFAKSLYSSVPSGCSSPSSFSGPEYFPSCP